MPTVTDEYGGENLEAGDLDGKDWTLTIARVERDYKGTDKNGKPYKKTRLHFEEAKRALVLNKTNANTIRAWLGYGNEMNGWIGRRITLYQTRCLSFGVPNTPCIRIRPTIPE